MNVHFGTQSVTSGAEWFSNMPSGLWFACLLGGEVCVERHDLGKRIWSSGDVFCFWQDDEVETYHRAVAEADLNCVFIHVAPENLDLVLGSSAQKSLQIGSNPKGLLLEPTNSALSNAVRSTAWQMLSSPRNGPGRKCFVAGKALEMLGATIDIASNLAASRTAPSAGIALAPYDVEACYQAHNVIMQNLANPPTIDQIARDIGTNSRKLNASFKEVFGLPIYSFVKSARMEKARLMIEAGEKSVSKVAYAFGYSPGHFATEFRKLYGISPKAFSLGRLPSHSE